DFPQKDDELELNFHVSLTQIRYITFHLEAHQIIRHKKIKYDRLLWKTAKEDIIRVKNERLSYKKEKLTTLVNWRTTTDCLRKNLYTLFQQSYTIKQLHCCSNCGFHFTNWEPDIDDISKGKTQDHLNWQQKLSHLLLGEVNE